MKAARLALGPVAARPGELTIKFVSNREIRKINKSFLGHDYATDVIAFAYEQTRRPTAEEPYGDIVISVDKAKEQSRDMKHSLLKELLTLIAHGVLHLQGYDDHAPKDKKRMFARQERVVAAIITR